MGAEVTILGRISSDIALVSAVRTTAAPTAHLFFSCLEYRVVSVMCGELGIEKGKTIFKGGKAPPEAVSGRATSYTYITGCYTVRRPDRGRPRRGGVSIETRVSVDDVIRCCTHDCVVTVVEASEPVVNKKKGSLRQCADKTLGTPCQASGDPVRLLSRCSGAIEITGVITIEGV